MLSKSATESRPHPSCRPVGGPKTQAATCPPHSGTTRCGGSRCVPPSASQSRPHPLPLNGIPGQSGVHHHKDVITIWIDKLDPVNWRLFIPSSVLPIYVFHLFGSDSKVSACNATQLISIPGSGKSLEKGMASHSSILDWRISCTEEPGRL